MLPALILVVGMATISYGFYVPGVAPRDFAKDDDVEIKVNIVHIPIVSSYRFIHSFWRLI